MIIDNVTQVFLNNNCYTGDTVLNSIDLYNVPFVNNSMYQAFKGCDHLTEIKHINSSVTNVDGAFWGCNSLTDAPALPPNITGGLHQTFLACKNMVNFPAIPQGITYLSHSFEHCDSMTTPPTIPNSVVASQYGFGYCNSLVTAPEIPDSVTGLYQMFEGCKNLKYVPKLSNALTSLWCSFWFCENLISIPNIPASLINIKSAFYDCRNLEGNIYIESNQITDATDCFLNTTKTKNVYIPFTYDNGVTSATYNSFTTAGYDTQGTQHGVYLKDINNKPQYYCYTYPSYYYLYIPEKVTTMGEKTFFASSNGPIHKVYAVEDLGQSYPANITYISGDTIGYIPLAEMSLQFTYYPSGDIY